jgi:saccharopine dehydrogenase (NAD+, L-lysine-forming)
MATLIGIRREDKSRWERRVPLAPRQVRSLRDKYEIKFCVQPSPVRVFREDEFEKAGAVVQDDLSPAPVILAVKEIPAQYFEPGKTYVFFAHVIKGQPHNMPMLKRMMELGCNLIDYEKVTDERGRRLIFFGWHAGVVAMIDSLWALGQRLVWESLPHPFGAIRNTYTYDNLDAARADVRSVGERIKAEGLPAALTPLIIGVAGYGNVGRGVQTILADLPTVEIQPAEVANVANDPRASRNVLYRVTFKEEHIVEPAFPGARFDVQDYYQHPDCYRSCFEQYVPHLTVLMNCNYWDSRYPRLVTKEYIQELFSGDKPPRLRLIGDASCDIEGGIECTVQSTEPDEPVYVYHPDTGAVTMGVVGRGPVILAVDILPSELPREASEYFSDILEPFIPAIAQADFSVPLEKLNLPPEIRRALILYHGELTPDFKYIAKYLAF